MANEDKYKPEGSAPDGTVVIEADDLKSSAKDTLASYLSDLTTNPATQNSYPVQNGPRVETNLEGSGGLPAEIQTGGIDSNTGFTRSFPSGGTSSEAAVGHFETLSNSGKIETLGSVLNKNSQSDGHHLLTDVVSNREPGEPGVGDPTGASSSASPSGAAPIQNKISQMLQTGNRFDPTPGSSPYIEDGEFTQSGIPIEQGQFGIYDDDAVRTSLADLHKIAHSLMVRSTGHRMGAGADPDGGSVLGATDVQKGSSLVNSNKLLAKNAYNAPARPELQNAELRYNDIDGTPLSAPKSYGQLSSYRETFEGGVLPNLSVSAQSLGEYLLGAAVFTAIISLVEILETGAPIHTPSNPSGLRKGSWYKEGTVLRVMRKLGIPRLDRPAWLCAIYGFAAFLKIPASALPSPGASGPPSPPLPPDPPVPSSTGAFAAIGAWFAGIAATADDTLFNVLYGSGYYANIFRVVRRDLDRMLTDITFATGGSGADPAIGIFNLLTQLNRYPAWNFFVAILRMGDAWLNSYQRYVRYNHMKMAGQTRQQHSRALTGEKGLAWRHRSAPALLLLNKKYVNASKVYGYHPNFFRRLHNALGDTYARTSDSPYWDNLRPGGRNRGLDQNSAWSNTRETRENVIRIENELDAEYCPFYFHDLRTNEVMSFHAFLGDLKDSYSVSYAESGGYGRIDKVKIYQDTTRSISLTFSVVATSPKDFDSMWWSVNKLISMIYPQFSMGKPVKAGSRKFIMPFSQIPTASPVIRLRVGDLIRSNYSRFNLARIFGLSEVKPAPVSGVAASSTAGEAISAAPFDITATAAIESAAADAAAEDEEAATSLEEEMTARFGTIPSSHADVAHGFLPGDPNWGKAILRANSGGYITWDTGPGVVIQATAGTATPAGVMNDHASNPPGEGATHVEASSFPSRPVTSGVVSILERLIDDPDGDGNVDAVYLVQYENRDDTADPYGPVSEKGHYHTYVAHPSDLTPIPPGLPTTTPADPTITLGQQITDVGDFFAPENNAIVRSFEAAGGRGLAGVITSFDMDWGDAQWDMSGIGRRAPTMLNISISFSPIHDIIPGLDNNGMMRAINYPVGEIAGPLGTDFYDPGGVRNSSHAATSTVPGAAAIDDATTENYDGFAGSIDTDGEGD